MAKSHIFVVKPADGDADATPVLLIRGTRSQVESMLISEFSIEPASVEEAVALGGKGVEIEAADVKLAE